MARLYIESIEATSLHPAEHRAYRELYASCRQLVSRWRSLAKRIADTPAAPSIETGVDRVQELLDELELRTADYDLATGPAAQGVAAGVAGLRSGVIDRGLDTGAALRLAVLDIEHVTTLLAQLAELAASRGDRDLQRFCGRWERTMRNEVKSVRRAAISVGADPERAAAPLDSSPLGQVIYRAGWALGTLGEWFDRRIGRATARSEDRDADAEEHQAAAPRDREAKTSPD